MRKFFKTGAIAFALAALMSSTAYAGAWKQDNIGWWWQNDNGTYPVNEWVQIRGSWYHFDSVGYMQTGWNQINGLWYYMYPDSGKMAANTYIDGYYLAPSGEWEEEDWEAWQNGTSNTCNYVNNYSSAGNGGNAQTNTSAGNSESTEAYRNLVVQYTNQERTKNGLRPLAVSEELNESAQVRAEETVTLFSHTRPCGEDCFTAFDEAGYEWRMVAENIAMGQTTPQEVTEAWMNSAGHRKNILNSQLKEIGVGVVKVNGTYYWVQNFGTPR